MLAGKQDAFYDEVLRALWGYVGDKLNIPVTELSHDNISEKLTAQHVDEPTVTKFMEALDECEFERYAPGDPAGNMNKTFDSAMTAIEKIEEAMKKNKTKRGSGVSALLLIIVMLLLPKSLSAITKQDADAEYSKGNYQQAIKDYEELLKAGESAEIYYNLGNAYYRTENITRAVLSYERALLLNPADEDIRFNLQMARSKTIDKITPESEMFFFTWYRSLVNLMTIDGWAHLAIASIILTLILALVYLFAGHLILRKIGFYGGVLFLIIFLLSNLFAFQQKQMLMKRNGAIVTAPSVTIKKTPVANSADQGVIHEGTRVDIIDDTMRDWKEIHLADGREGWIPATQIEKI
jgi:tetratricopeptide (TPR) repeat protein